MGFQKGTLKRYHWREDICDVDLGCVEKRLEAHKVVIWRLKEYVPREWDFGTVEAAEERFFYWRLFEVLWLTFWRVVEVHSDSGEPRLWSWLCQ